MNNGAFIALVHNAALLLALVLVFDFATTHFPLERSRLRQLIFGTILGAMGVGIMLAPFRLVPGIVFDTRSVLLAVCGLFFGFIPTLVAVMLTAVYRLTQGGAAAWTGVGVIFASGGLGLLWRHYHQSTLEAITWRQLYSLGLAVHAVMLLLMLTLGWETARVVLAGIGLPVLIIYPLATAALGMLLVGRLRRGRMAARLLASESRFAGFFRSNPLPCIISEFDTGRIVDVNPAFLKATGYTRVQAIGRTALELNLWSDPQGRSHVLASLQKPAGLGGQGLPISWRSADGEIREALGFYEVWREGGAGHLLGIFIDVTERNRLQAALHENEERLRLALTAANQGTYDVNLQTGECVVSPEYARMLGYDPAEFRETLTAWMDRLHPDEVETLKETMQRYLAGELPEFRMEFRQRSRTGDWVWILSMGRLVERDAAGRPRRMLGTHTDITPRKLAEVAFAGQHRRLEDTVRQLEQSRSMLQLIIESIPLRVFWKGKDLRYQGCNNLFARDAGFDQPSQLLGKDDFAMGWREQAELYQKDDREVMTTGRPKLNYLEPQTKPDGTKIWLSTSKVPLQDASGAVVGILGIFEDITERRRAEQQITTAQVESVQLLVEAGRTRQSLLSMVEDLRNAEQRLQVEQELAQSTLDALQEHICVVDASGVIIAVNRAWREFAAANGAAPGFTGVGLNYLEVCERVTGSEAGPAAEFSARLREVLEDRVAAVEMEYPCDAPGERRWFIARATRFAGQGAVRVVIAHENLTARKQAEERLQDSQDRWRHAVQGSAAGVWEVNYLTGESFYSDRSKEMLGYGPDDLPQDREVWTALIHPEDVAIGRQAMAEHLAGRKPFYEAEHRFRCKDGSYRWISSHAQAVFDANGRLIRIAGTHVDLHERKLVEENLRATVRDNEALLKEVHHRVKNNLQVITSLLRLEAGQIREPGTKVVLREMQDRIRSMALLHETLYRTGIYAAVNLSVYLRQLTHQLFRAHNTDPGRIHLVLDLAVVQVEMDQAIPCGLIVNELTINSLKHAFPAQSAGEVRISLSFEPDGQLCLCVSDNGAGLPEDFALAKSNSLGLSLVSDLTRQLQGRLVIGTGPGARFSVTFNPVRSSGSKSPFDPAVTGLEPRPGSAPSPGGAGAGDATKNLLADSPP